MNILNTAYGSAIRRVKNTIYLQIIWFFTLYLLISGSLLLGVVLFSVFQLFAQLFLLPTHIHEFISHLTPEMYFI